MVTWSVSGGAGDEARKPLSPCSSPRPSYMTNPHGAEAERGRWGCRPIISVRVPPARDSEPGGGDEGRLPLLSWRSWETSLPALRYWELKDFKNIFTSLWLLLHGKICFDLQELNIAMALLSTSESSSGTWLSEDQDGDNYVPRGNEKSTVIFFRLVPAAEMTTHLISDACG